MASKYIFKYIIIGDTGVGKSCLLLRFMESKFNTRYEVTVGVEFGAKVVNINEDPVKLQIWDTAGQETFKSITRSYYRSAAGGLLVYDVTNRESFENVHKWLLECREHGNPLMTIILIGNKVDMEDKREVSTEEGQKCAQDNGLLFIETSAKTADHVENAFLDTATQIYNKVEKGEIDISSEAYGVKPGNATISRPKNSGGQGLNKAGLGKSEKKEGGCC